MVPDEVIKIFQFLVYGLKKVGRIPICVVKGLNHLHSNPIGNLVKIIVFGIFVQLLNIQFDNIIDIFGHPFLDVISHYQLFHHSKG